MSVDWFWALTTLAASGAGLVIGYWLGSMSSQVYQLKEALVAAAGGEMAEYTEEDRRKGVERRTSNRQSHLNVTMGASLILLAVFSVTTQVVQVTKKDAVLDRQAAAIACQSEYNIAFSESLNERAQAVIRDRRAIRDLVQTAASVRADPPARARARMDAAFRDFLDATAEADDLRAAAPVPAFPADRDCAELLLNKN